MVLCEGNECLYIDMLDEWYNLGFSIINEFESKVYMSWQVNS